MPAPLTIIIPTLNAADSLPDTLKSLFEGVSEGLIAELIFADGGSRDATAKIAQDVGARLVTSDAGRGTQLHAGALTADTPWLLFIHADTDLSAGWPRILRGAMSDDNLAHYGRLRFADASVAARIVAGWANLRSRVFGLPYGDQTLLISSKLYASIGGYPDIPLMEDVAIARKLRGKLRALDVTATTSAARYVRDGWVRRGWRNLSTLALYFCGRAPADLAKRYRR